MRVAMRCVGRMVRPSLEVLMKVIILPTHRIATRIHDFSWPAVRRHLEPWFAAEAFPFSNDAEKAAARKRRSEEHMSELQSRFDLVCRLLLEKKKKKQNNTKIY